MVEIEKEGKLEIDTIPVDQLLKAFCKIHSLGKDEVQCDYVEDEMLELSGTGRSKKWFKDGGQVHYKLRVALDKKDLTRVIIQMQTKKDGRCHTSRAIEFDILDLNRQPEGVSRDYIEQTKR